ncbi:MAG: SMC-Scp complex subunit ScpB, partial [Candidatus Omnitrophica bacterium]|nr:SMC-Scp complex subunit ScpB [Candidatus Omnitrophota bacterium]
LETLAIIAYKQPVTRLDIESLRGVNVDGVMRNLLDKSLVRIAGRKNSPGRPFVYGTTRQFLEYFGLKSLDELPKIEEFVKVANQKEKELIEEKKEEENEPEKTTQENR